MDNLLLGALTDDEDVLEVIEILEPARMRRPKIFQLRENHFEKWNAGEFLKRFRFSKTGVRLILQQIQEQIKSPTERNHAVSPEQMLLVTLRFLATGSFLQVAGDFIGISKATASQIIHKVTRAIASLHTVFIKMPATEDDCRRNSNQFHTIARFPKCIGALDCTHVKIASPGGEEPEIYRNRKGFFSMNVQVICDATLKIQNIVCRWPGSSHDSTIFNNSRIRAKFEAAEYGRYLILGDSGYAIRPFLLTPLRAPVTRAEQLYNESQIRTRNPVERCFGVWKRRFPALAFGIRLKLHKVEAVVVATAVLHNIAIILNEEEPPLDPEEEAAVNFVNDVLVENIGENGGNFNQNNSMRDQLIREYFNNLPQF
ncbi:hypothetical protein Zmor_013188 [Zophobas morio]|uniref:Putative nuclease HARBI1 n=1 Tax=Zophobas morio TaxID=2755281 RepID=A0AA38ICR7_9CUCU|nr:hypothetical protein Zmor_013188 [Zophobas morio]